MTENVNPNSPQAASGPTEFVLSLVRHGLTLAGGGLVTRGLTDENQLSGAIGAVLTLIGFGWSLHRQMARARAAKTQPPPTAQP